MQTTEDKAQHNLDSQISEEDRCVCFPMILKGGGGKILMLTIVSGVGYK